MSGINLFEMASRQKFRFESRKGLLSVEDLWELPLTSNISMVNLDDIARSLHRQVRESDNEISFVVPTKEAEKTPQFKLELIKHIIAAKIAERDAAQQAAARKEQKQRLLELISSKENESLAGLSLEELRSMVEKL